MFCLLVPSGNRGGGRISENHEQDTKTNVTLYADMTNEYIYKMRKDFEKGGRYLSSFIMRKDM
jgi:hypothetical protein